MAHWTTAVWLLGAAALLLLGEGQAAQEMQDYKDHPCIRECQAGGQPMVCEYNFTLEYYFTLTKACYDCPFNRSHCARRHCVALDGVDRGLVTVNRMLPGPGIHVCLGDEVVVNVLNRLEGMEGASIHWHGVLQHGSQVMDGTPFLTQCPISPNSVFQYRFRMDRPGTHFYHSHSGFQRADGHFGALVAREPRATEPHALLYDEDLPEHTLIVHDWLEEFTGNRFAHHHHGDGDNKPRLMLINGMGAFKEFKDAQNVSHYTPKATFTVTPGKRYRFRVISNGILNCPIQVSVDGHTLTVIASDGVPFQPVTVDVFTIFAGERYDFVLEANKTVASYWVRVRGLADCGVKKAHQTAILRYQGAEDADPPGPTDWDSAARGGIELNPLNYKGDNSRIPISRLESVLADDATSRPRADRTLYLAMDFYSIDNMHFNHPDLYPLQAVTKNNRLYSPQVNHISNTLPAVPALTQGRHPRDYFCNAETMVGRNCTQEYCECTHLYEVGLGELVELVLIDEGVPFDANHPMHLHGHSFRVVAMDRVNGSTSLEQIKAMDMAGNITRKLSHAPVKDTVTVPDGGYTVVRFIADNPGVWFMHCHIEFHVEIGMGVVFQVGRPDQFPRFPKNFPRCGDWHYEGLASQPQSRPPCPPTGSVARVASVPSHVLLFASAVLFLSILR